MKISERLRSDPNCLCGDGKLAAEALEAAEKALIKLAKYVRYYEEKFGDDDDVDAANLVRGALAKLREAR